MLRGGTAAEHGVEMRLLLPPRGKLRGAGPSLPRAMIMALIRQLDSDASFEPVAYDLYLSWPGQLY